MEYIIVQAGGKGTRLTYLTENKPKALVPIENLPMLFYLFRKFPDKKYVIIADYQKEVLRHYLRAFANVKYEVVDAVGKGTASGVREALSRIPDAQPFMLVWSDLILPKDLCIPLEYLQNDPSKVDKNYIGISMSFSCRWKYENGKFAEERSTEHGVAGFFLFKDKEQLKDVPSEGELVRWMSESGMIFGEVSLAGTREFGLIEDVLNLGTEKCRPFNRAYRDGDFFVKEAIDEQGRNLAVRENAWYKKAQDLRIPVLPRIYGYDPLKMEYVQGENIYDCVFSYDEKKKILEKLVESLQLLHSAECVPTDSFSMQEAYFNKTMKRLEKVRDLVPFAREPFITVNGRKCRNIFFHQDELEHALERMKCDHFAFIHGDCTFSNLMVRDTGEPVLIDPRGYFGYTELFGDSNYDWAKLYYSIVGNYDRFNLKKFSLVIGGNAGHADEKETGKAGNQAGCGLEIPVGEIKLSIESNKWEDLEKDFFEMTGTDPYEIRLLHAVIWLSLTTYAWQDYDSICGAFYNGLYYLEEVL
ncbi:Phosphotransferase enzyme family protein [Lachnospiraceae bacterium]|nr:Phosphotransferase enzyme family protein [Lachnospiraceae bacterium]